MCQCTVYAILTVRLLHYHHIGKCIYFISQQTRYPVLATIEEIRVTLGPLCRFGPPALLGLPMASYASALVLCYFNHLLAL